jgi:hypothetical protein
MTLSPTFEDRVGWKVCDIANWACRRIGKNFPQLRLDLLIGTRWQAGQTSGVEERVLVVLMTVAHDARELLTILDEIRHDWVLFVVLQVMPNPTASYVCG